MKGVKQMSERNNKSGRVTSKGQVAIPVNIRKELNIEEGDRVEFVREANGDYKIQVMKKRSLRDVVGILKTDKEIPV
jgi:antitoxin PrlF